MRQAPNAINTVRTAGISSGSMAIAKVKEVNRPLMKSCLIARMLMITMQRTAAMITILLTNLETSCLNRESSFSIELIALPILPSSVPMPVATT